MSTPAFLAAISAGLLAAGVALATSLTTGCFLGAILFGCLALLNIKRRR